MINNYTSIVSTKRVKAILDKKRKQTKFEYCDGTIVKVKPHEMDIGIVVYCLMGQKKGQYLFGTNNEDMRYFIEYKLNIPRNSIYKYIPDTNNIDGSKCNDVHEINSETIAQIANDLIFDLQEWQIEYEAVINYIFESNILVRDFFRNNYSA